MSPIIAPRTFLTLALTASLFSLGLSGCKHADSSKSAAVETVIAKPAPLPKQATPPTAAVPKGPVLPKSVDTKGLDPAEVKILAQILEDQFDPCGKPRSFKASVAAGDCAMATRLVRFVSYKLQQGYGKRKILALLLREIERLNTVVELDLDGAPRVGPEKSKVKVVIFSDFQCPFCSKAYKPLKKLQQHYGVAVYYKHFPLRQAHEYAEGAARAAWAAQQQGKFWEMHDTLFANNHALKWEDVKGYAKKLGLNGKKFQAAVKSEESKKAVERDYQQGREAQVDGTPTFFINGRRAETLRQLQDAIREHLGLAGVKKLPEPLEISEAAPAGDAPKQPAAPAH
ncbi:MAG: thioredoxin domain-containing protein [Myxococcales bacterium]|nr:thioredoxin domain-containing protein [Myxococcales bacterium]